MICPKAHTVDIDNFKLITKVICDEIHDKAPASSAQSIRISGDPEVSAADPKMYLDSLHFALIVLAIARPRKPIIKIKKSILKKMCPPFPASTAPVSFMRALMSEYQLQFRFFCPPYEHRQGFPNT